VGSCILNIESKKGRARCAAFHFFTISLFHFFTISLLHHFTFHFSLRKKGEPHCWPRAVHCPPSTVHCSLSSVHCPLFTVHCSCSKSHSTKNCLQPPQSTDDARFYFLRVNVTYLTNSAKPQNMGSKTALSGQCCGPRRKTVASGLQTPFAPSPGSQKGSGSAAESRRVPMQSR
jgi:hypothetical protein